MPWPFRKRRTAKAISDDLEIAFNERNEPKAIALIEEMINLPGISPEELEAYAGRAVLVGVEFKWKYPTKYLPWFMKAFPNSLFPVRVEFAKFLEATGKPDSATQLSREYLRDLKLLGALDHLASTIWARKGAGQAFLLLTAAYTEMGARSYSLRILEFACLAGVERHWLATYHKEMQRLRDEMREPANALADARWEECFQSGKHIVELIKECDAKGCRWLAERLDLMRGTFMFGTPAPASEEMLLVVCDVQVEGQSEPARVLMK